MKILVVREIHNILQSNIFCEAVTPRPKSHFTQPSEGVESRHSTLNA